MKMSSIGNLVRPCGFVMATPVGWVSSTGKNWGEPYTVADEENINDSQPHSHHLRVARLAQVVVNSR